MDRLHNPFTPGAGALPPELAGRTKAIGDGRVLAGRTMPGRYEKSLMLVGLRGVGKTVLLKYLAEAARREQIVPVIVEVRNSQEDMEGLSLRLREALSTLDFAAKVKARVNYAFSVLAERLGRPVTALSTLRTSLIRKGMPYLPAHGVIAYTVPLFGMYMKRVMPQSCLAELVRCSAPGNS